MTVARPPLMLLILIGIIGGVFSGAFGGGGGVIIVPMLVLMAGFDQRRAAATSLLAIIPSCLAGGITYLLQGHVDLIAVLAISGGAIVGAIAGSLLLKRLPLVGLRWGFIVLLLAVAVRMAFLEPERGRELELTVGLVLAYVAIGLFTGLCSGLFGVGGAVIAVPALVAFVGMSDLIAKGTTLLVMVVTSTTGSVVNRSTGLVDVRAGVTVGVVAAAASVLGAFLALGMPARLSSALFAVLLVLVAVQLTVRAVRS